MFSVGEDVEADALFKRGWTVSAIARHLGRDRKTVRSYLSGERTPGVRRTASARPARRVPRLRGGPLRRRPAPVGLGALRRGRASRLRLLVCELRPPDPPGRPAPALRGLLRGEGPRDHRDRPPRRRRDPVGLVRAAPCPVGGDGLRAARHAVALGAHPRRAVRVDGPGPSHRGHGRRAAPPGRHGPQVAHRPLGHGDRAGQRRRPGQLRPGGQALRGHRHPVPAEAREPQGGRRVRREVLLRALVAHHDGHRPGRGPVEPGPVLVDHRRRPPAPARALSSTPTS